MKKVSAPIAPEIVQAMQEALMDDLAEVIGNLDHASPPSSGAAARRARDPFYVGPPASPEPAPAPVRLGRAARLGPRRGRI